jgi:hypothetical protein
VIGRLRPDLAVAMYTRLVDRLAVSVSGQFREAGIDHLVVKGPAIAHWLYGPDEVRTYGDVDVLVRQPDWDRAVALLHRHGFDDAMAGMAHPRMESYASHPYRSVAGDVDLHATFKGLTADMDAVWEAFSEGREVLRLPEGELEMPSEAARLMHVALHAAQHLDGKAVDDLERALDQLSDDHWHAAAEVAAATGGMAAFLSGLRTVQAGRNLAMRLRFPDVHSVESLLHSSGVPLAEALHQLATEPGWRAKAALAWREAFPTSDFMRWSSTLARRGPLGLLAAYVRRQVYLASRLPGALRALRRARRAVTKRR